MILEYFEITFTTYNLLLNIQVVGKSYLVPLL